MPTSGSARDARHAASAFKHLITDSKELITNVELLRDKRYIRMFIDEVVSKVGMEKWGIAKFKYLYEPIEIRGLCAVQFLNNANITLSIFEETNTMFFELFSTIGFDVDVVLRVMCKYFSAGTIQYQVVKRGFTDE